MPPLLEYVESLLSGTGRDLDLQMFKLVDQMSGRTMGLRADITPQVARIDAHLLNRPGVTRLCYAGSVLYTRPRSLTGTREPLRGRRRAVRPRRHRGRLRDPGAAARDAGRRWRRRRCGSTSATPRSCARSSPPIRAASWSPTASIRCCRARRATTSPRSKARSTASTCDALTALVTLNGGIETIADARAPPAAAAARSARRSTCSSGSRRCSTRRRCRSISPTCAGTTITAARCSRPTATACRTPSRSGGRYDEVGLAFGRARPATGFSLDLRELARLARRGAARAPIVAPWGGDAPLRAAIARLAGRRRDRRAATRERRRRRLESRRSLVARDGALGRRRAHHAACAGRGLTVERSEHQRARSHEQERRRHRHPVGR